MFWGIKECSCCSS